MFRREMCTGKIGIEARREGLSARREEKRNELLRNRRNMNSSEKKVVIPKPKESVSERRARLEQYREMKTSRELKLRAERLKTPAFKVGQATARERVTPSTARKMLDFDFKKTSGSESSSASKSLTSRKALLFGNDSVTATKLKPAVRTTPNTESGPKIAVRRNLQRDLTSTNAASQQTKTPQPASKTSTSEQKGATPSTKSMSGRATPKIGLTPSRTLTNRFTPSKTAASSTLKGTPSSSKSTRTPLVATSSRQGAKATPKEVVTKPGPTKTPITPSNRGSVKSNFARTKLSAKKATPSAVGTKATPSKSASTPLKSVEPKRDVSVIKTTPKPTPLAPSTHFNRLKQSTEKEKAETNMKKLNTTPRKPPTTTTLKRAQSTCNLSRPCPPQSVKNPGRFVGSRNPQSSTTLKRAQSTNNLSRPSPSSSVTKSRLTAPQNGTPQGKLLRSTSVSTLARKALSSASPEIKPRLNLSKKFVGDSKSENKSTRQDDNAKRQPITRSMSTLTSATKPSAMSRIKAAVLRKNERAKAEVQKQNVSKSDEMNNKKWASLMALIQAQKAS